jgi:hypothetical protein
MARKSQSAKVHELKGNYRPSRHRGKGRVGGAPIRPKGMPDYVSAAWQFLVRAAKQAQTPLTRADEPALEAASYLLAQIRKSPSGVSSSAWNQYRGYLRELQLTAATRPPAKPPDDDSWDF